MNDNLNELYIEEKSISIIDWFFYILRRWRSILAVALIAALAAGLLIYLKSTSDSPSVSMTPEELKEQFCMSNQEMEDFNQKFSMIRRYEQIVRDCNKYLESSIKANVDPNGYYEGNLSYVISGDSPEAVLETVLQCKGELEENNTVENMAQSMEEQVSDAFLREAVEITIGKYPEQKVAINGNEEVLNITVFHYNRTECEKMLTCLATVIDDKIDEMVQNENAVTVTKVADAVVLTSNRELIEEKEKIATIQSRAYDALVSIKGKMSDVQKQYYELEVYAEGEKEQQAVAVQGGGINWKYALAAAVIAAFCMAGFYAVVYLVKGYVHTKRELESWVMVPITGYHPKNKNKRNNFIDQLLDRMQRKSNEASENTMEMLGVALKSYADQAEVKEIYLSGSCMEKEDMDVLKRLRENLQAEGIELIIGKNILTNAQAFQEAVSCGNVVFWEICYQSRENDVRSEIMRVLSCGAKVLTVVLEN